jgi:hypothetical protein
MKGDDDGGTNSWRALLTTGEPGKKDREQISILMAVWQADHSMALLEAWRPEKL